MPTYDEIVHRLERRLEVLIDEADRVRAAIDALGPDGGPIGPADEVRPARLRPPTSPDGGPAIRTRGNTAEPRVAGARPGLTGAAAGGNDATLTVGERMLSELRRELAAGLRST